MEAIKKKLFGVISNNSSFKRAYRTSKCGKPFDFIAKKTINSLEFYKGDTRLNKVEDFDIKSVLNAFNIYLTQYNAKKF